MKNIAKDKKIFKITSEKTRSINVRPGMRGGIRL